MSQPKFRLAAIVYFILCGVAIIAAQAQSPNIIWQTAPALNKVYYSLKFTSDGTQLVAGGSERSGGGTDGVLLQRFDAEKGNVLLTAPSSFIYFGASEIALSPDGQRITTANFDTRCTLPNPPACDGGFLQYETTEFSRLSAPPNSNAPNYAVDYAPDGQLIALGGLWYNYGPTNYFNLRLVRADDLSPVRTMEGHLRGPNNGGTLSVQFSPDGTLLGSSGHDKFVKIWRVVDGTLLRAFNFDDAYKVDSVAFSPSGEFIAAGRTDYDAQIKVWRVATGELIRTFDVSSQSTSATFNKVTWTPDGSNVVAGISFGVGYGENKIKFWNVFSGQLAAEYSTPADRFINDIVFSPSGQTFAYAVSSQVFVASNPFSAKTLKTRRPPVR